VENWRRDGAKHHPIGLNAFATIAAIEEGRLISMELQRNFHNNLKVTQQ